MVKNDDGMWFKVLLCALVFMSWLTFAVASDEGGTAEPKPERYDPVIELPAGAARELVLEACTKCHTLEGLTAYKGYWGKPQWFAMVESMVKNGAKLDPAQMDQVADYLTVNFGPDAP